MYVLIVSTEADDNRSRIHLVDEDGKLEWSGRTMQEALDWLIDHGELSVTAITDVGPELFLIEPCAGFQLTLPSYSLRRAHHGRCCEPPALPGLRPDPTRAARVTAQQKDAALELRHRRRKWTRRAAG